MRRATFLLSLLIVFLLAVSFGCGGPSSTSGGPEGTGASSGAPPELTDDIIRERINYTRVREVPEETGIAPPIVWNFDHDEPKEIKIVERQINVPNATLILDIKTESAPGSRVHRKLSGQIRTEWKLETGWVLRKWEIVRTENISMKYKDYTSPPVSPPPSAGNTNVR